MNDENYDDWDDSGSAPEYLLRFLDGPMAGKLRTRPLAKAPGTYMETEYEVTGADSERREATLKKVEPALKKAASPSPPTMLESTLILHPEMKKKLDKFLTTPWVYRTALRPPTPELPESLQLREGGFISTALLRSMDSHTLTALTTHLAQQGLVLRPMPQVPDVYVASPSSARFYGHLVSERAHDGLAPRWAGLTVVTRRTRRSLWARLTGWARFTRRS